MRIRTIKPAFWKSETLSQVAKEHRLLAVALLNYADDEGYFQAHEALIRGECFPFDEDSASVHRGLDELSRVGFIGLGTSQYGQRVGRVVNFRDHQKIDKPTKSKYFGISVTWDKESQTSPSPPRMLAEPSTTEVEGKGREVNLRVVADTSFARFWEAWPASPRKVGKAKCLQVWQGRKLAALVEQIIANVAAMKSSEQWRKGFDPAPLTYLNQRRWEDGEGSIPPRPRDEFAGCV